ncbi:MAG: class I SAM-dependent methyltransferase [Pseudomonadota bacterium]|nr:class I SAM-dependent methyltransferase [Pseudomonadota bacterium]
MAALTTGYRARLEDRALPADPSTPSPRDAQRPRDVHRALLEKWRKTMDLVGPGPVDPHFDDAEAAVGWLAASGAWADLGSGAGFPGIMLAETSPGATVTLVERRQKRCAFLEAVVAAAKLPNATVVCTDAAELPRAHYDGIVSRAYKAPIDMLEEGRRLLRPAGLLVLLLAREEPPVAPDFELFHVERYAVEGRPRAAVALRFRG